ncbi:MAG: Tat pathway signal protein [Candidatus Brocadiae bacterium]|nr:Tat pathway signal protein [Candidatus Brocadiia bacterium]
MKILSFLLLLFLFCAHSQEQSRPMDPFLKDLQYKSFLYFWELTNPQNGLTPDRYPTKSFSSIAAVGFALSSYLVGIEKKFISREEAAQRVFATLKFFWEAPQGTDPEKCTGYKGFFYHFLDMETGLRYKDVELSSIDTTLLLAGILSCQVYFDQDNPLENQIRDYADKIYLRIDWKWMQARPPLVSMGWCPEKGFLESDWKGYNEAMILYILALASPTHPVSHLSWEAWTKTYLWAEFYGQTHVNFSPLFGHQYSHVWIDFQGIQDEYMKSKGIDYFINSRKAVYSNRAYCMANPSGFKGYSAEIWGLTACDGPENAEYVLDGKKQNFQTYWARGASLVEIQDDGTIAPTAVGGSIPFAPEICIPALKKMNEIHSGKIMGKYGFYDAFNETYPKTKGNAWIGPDWLGIDNGPIVLMIENYHSGLLWKWMKKCPYIVSGLKKASFHGGWLDKN